MSSRAPLAASVLLCAGGLVGAVALPASASVCEPYTQVCTTPASPSSSVGPTSTSSPRPSSTTTTGLRPSETSTPSSSTPAGRGDTTQGDLAFTGGEVALMSLLGAGALAGGGALVVAGRRRRVHD